MKRSNRQRVKLGLSPYLENDEKVELHHDKQDFFGKLLEVSVGFHAMMATDPDYHPFTTDPGYASWRNLVAVYNGKCRSLGEIANMIKEKYWMMRDL
jgi:hypothetical protein